MKVALTGVLDDGTPFAPGVPTNPRANLNVPRGVDLDLEIRVVTPSGASVSLVGAGVELLFTVKKRPEEYPPRIIKTATLAGTTGTVRLEPGDTRRLQPGLFGYDVWLTKDGRRNPVIPLSPFQLQASAAAVPAQPPPPVVQVTEGDTDPFVITFAPTDITGWLVELQVATDPATILVASIPVGTDGLAYVNTSGLHVGRWGASVRRTNLVPNTKTTETFILEVLASIAP